MRILEDESDETYIDKNKELAANISLSDDIFASIE
jgi:hypothetical protein